MNSEFKVKIVLFVVIAIKKENDRVESEIAY